MVCVSDTECPAARGEAEHVDAAAPRSGVSARAVATGMEYAIRRHTHGPGNGSGAAKTLPASSGAAGATR
ncbi:hypothetical protein BCAR13_960007 [Paraburkholderia caribensis]|nr:hypothetical protein BCAR13_960007 [Paraburkholderia caribensis]